jgi:hypothetical protein
VKQNVFAAGQRVRSAQCCWRVDAVLADGTLVKGDVWTFTVEPVAVD